MNLSAPLPRADRPTVIAHRGASADHPENTLRAFAAALDTADGLELDVRLTRDGHAVVFHDDDTADLTGSPGTIEGRSFEEVQRLTVAGLPIPTLDAVLELWRERAPDSPWATLNIEIKPTARARAAIDSLRPSLDPVRDHGLVVSSFDPRVLQAAIQAGAPWPLAYIYEDLRALSALSWLEAPQVLDLHPASELMTEAHLAEYRAAGRAFRVWTVDDPAEAARLARLGADAIITNRPREILASLTKGGPA